MKSPQNVHAVLNEIHKLLGAIAGDLENYLEDPVVFGPEYFESIRDAALDAHLLTTWVKDQLSYPKE